MRVLQVLLLHLPQLRRLQAPPARLLLPARVHQRLQLRNPIHKGVIAKEVAAMNLYN